MTENKERTPSWIRRLVRMRMAATGEKYTTALRAVKLEIEEGESRSKRVRLRMADTGVDYDTALKAIKREEDQKQ